MVKWSNIIIERPHCEFMKQLYQARYFNHFMSLNQNVTLISLTVNGTIDWKLSSFYFNFNGDKFSTDFESSGLKVFKIKCLTLTLPTLTVLKTRYPFIYNNYEWSCPYDVETVDYGNIKSHKRRKMDEDFNHLWTCSYVQPIVSKIIEDFKYLWLNLPTYLLAHQAEHLLLGRVECPVRHQEIPSAPRARDANRHERLNPSRASRKHAAAVAEEYRFFDVVGDE